jgi:nicotinate-nucleotide--dimethylbenzimidazole phosphoribosyltransferase
MTLLDETLADIQAADARAAALAAQRLDRLTKPRGSLGRLEDIVRQYAALRRDPDARTGSGALAVFVADHGVTDEGVSAYPKSVTAEMLRNIARGGAAISVLARRFGYSLRVTDVGVAADTRRENLPNVAYRRVRAGTRNFAREPAMTPEEMHAALAAGIETVRELAAGGATLVGLGEMGIGNSTAAAAVLCATSGLPPERIVGRGTGVDDEGWRRKVGVVSRAIERHGAALASPASLLASVGGLEIAAMAGACIAGAAGRVAIVVDGFIATAAAAAAVNFDARVIDYLFFSHRSAEGGHALALDHLGARPLLDLDLRLGEGTGAAIAMTIIEAALALYREMATFEQAGVSEKIE